MINVSLDSKLDKQINSFSRKQRARIDRVVKLFRDEDFKLNEVYLKKLTKNIWELRPGSIRLLFGMAGSEAIIVNIFIKKTAKTPRKEIELAEKRLQKYL